MQVWKRRVVALVAAGVGGAGVLMSTAGAQTTPPRTVPTFSIPDVSIPDFSIPPPTMRPPTSSTTTPPPTMPPPSTSTSAPPPTMPPTPTTIPDDIDALIEDAISRIEEFGEGFSELINDLRGLLDAF